jgi:hypothetical protein
MADRRSPVMNRHWVHDVDYEALMRMALTEAELAIPHGDFRLGGRGDRCRRR